MWVLMVLIVQLLSTTSSGNGKRKLKCLFIKAGPVCDLTVCQKSIYLAEQGDRSQPRLKDWVSSRLSPSALSVQNEGAPSSNTHCDTSWASGWKEQWGVVLSHKRFPLGVTRRALVSPHASTAHEQRGSTLVTAHDQGHYKGKEKHNFLGSYTSPLGINIGRLSNRVQLHHYYTVCTLITLISPRKTDNNATTSALDRTKGMFAVWLSLLQLVLKQRRVRRLLHHIHFN